MTLSAPDKTAQTELEAAAFRRLTAHLRERADVQNIDLMTLAGFCRNCLANWYVDAAKAAGTPCGAPTFSSTTRSPASRAIAAMVMAPSAPANTMLAATNRPVRAASRSIAAIDPNQSRVSRTVKPERLNSDRDPAMSSVT